MRTVVFDLGSTLLDETELWRTVASELGVGWPVFAAELQRAAVEHGDTIRVFETFGARPVFPEIDYTEQMLYSDARPCLSEAT